MSQTFNDFQTNRHKYDENIGLLLDGEIDSYNPNTGVLFVKLNRDSLAIGQSELTVRVQSPNSLSYNNGLFIGSYPVKGTPVVVGQGNGGKFFFVAFKQTSIKTLPKLNLDELLVRANDNTKISLTLSNDIIIGSYSTRLHINSKTNLISHNFDNEFRFTQAGRYVNGIVKRDTSPNFLSQDSKLDSDSFNFNPIGMDPKTAVNASIVGSSKNPPFVENRELVYEFQYDAEISNDLVESSIYNGKSLIQNFTRPNRRKSRTDTLSLTLASPNYLMETVKGTVVDIFGNILDINRYPLPVGQGANTLNVDNNGDKIQAFLNIKQLERKSIAYHFEINARKDFGQKTALPDINSNDDYARNRSRFFVDIDKEGQFKLNVPASSEKGNIPLLARYENFSTISSDDNNNPDKLLTRNDNLDIFLDSCAAPKMTLIAEPTQCSFAQEKGSITIMDGDSLVMPQDRITGGHIMHGTAYHDILQTCYTHQTADFLKYPNEYGSLNLNFTIPIDSFPVYTDIVSDTINIGGDNPNAGGRSASLMFDGSIELNVGANTIDRQSLWLDTAGSMIANFGRDNNGISAALSMNGDLVIQVGGIGVDSDSRFNDQNNRHRAGAIDIRVLNDGGRATLVRIENGGVYIMTPSMLELFAGQGMKITSDNQIDIEAETVMIQGRAVIKEFGGSI